MRDGMGHHDDKRWDERVVDYIYGELEPTDAVRFEAEMARRPELAAEVRELQAVAHLAAADADPIPDPPEAAIAEAMTAARTRCDGLRDAAPGLWERVSAWLMTPQLAGALTLVLIISVGIYTVGTGVFSPNDADQASMRVEMAPVKSATETKAEVKAEAKAEAKAVAKTMDEGVVLPTEELEEQVAPARAQDSARAPFLETTGTIQTPPAPWDTDGEEPSEDKTAELPREREASQWLRPLMDNLSKAGDLRAALVADEALSEETASDTRSMERERTDIVEARLRASGETGNFVPKTMSKLKEKAAKKKTATPYKKVQKKDVQQRKDKGNEQETFQRLRKAKEEAPAPKPKSSSTKKVRRDNKKAKLQHVTTKSLLDGLVVPPDAGPAKKQPAMQVRTSNEPITVLSAVPEVVGGGEDDGFMGVASGGSAPTRGQFGSGAADEDTLDDVATEAEPDYLLRPEAAEAPGVPMGSMERSAEDKPEDLKKETDEAEEKKPTPAPVRGGSAAACAALYKALEEAEEAEDWALAEELSLKIVALGCVVAVQDFEAVQEQRSGYKLKAIEADDAPVQSEVPVQSEAPAEKAPALKKAAEPTETK